jgi:uncharacterized membrane protein (DUF485 family)
MAERLTPNEAEAGGRDDPVDIDWEAIERSPEFQELVRRRRAFVVPCTIFFLVYFMAFMVVTAYAPDFMGERVYEGLTVGYVLALTQFLMVFVLGLWYLRKSAREFDPLSDKAIEGYAEREGLTEGERSGGGRFNRGATAAADREVVK